MSLRRPPLAPVRKRLPSFGPPPDLRLTCGILCRAAEGRKKTGQQWRALPEPDPTCHPSSPPGCPLLSEDMTSTLNFGRLPSSALRHRGSSANSVGSPRSRSDAVLLAPCRIETEPRPHPRRNRGLAKLPRRQEDLPCAIAEFAAPVNPRNARACLQRGYSYTGSVLFFRHRSLSCLSNRVMK